MRRLSRHEDPTGFFNMVRAVASDRFGDPRGVIQGHGRLRSVTKKGPGRLHGQDYPTQQRNAHGSKWLRPNVMRRGH